MHIVRHFEGHKNLYSSAAGKEDIEIAHRRSRAIHADEPTGVPVYAVCVDQFEAQKLQDGVRVSPGIHGQDAYCVALTAEGRGRDRAIKDSEVETPYPDYIADLRLSGEAFRP